MKNRFIVAPLLAFACTLSAWAQTQKIAVIDMQSALLGTKDGQKAAAELKAKFAPKEQELTKKQQDLQGKSDQLRKTENTISEEAKAALQAEIATLQRNLQRDSQDANQDLQEEQQRILGDLSQKMNQVMGKYAQEKQLTMIFDVSGQPNNVLFASSTIDITRDIIALYDSSAPVTPPARTPAAAPPAKAPATAPAPAAPKKPATAPPPAAH
ncbi:MAG TPA: OmpH family outer membrane protein [Bryobacteraceae bacterium]|nr:OmpH family outer membrane protein [Bryobacteraceae bacterium]